jgi:AmmeMemoRadiSam system protein B
VTPGPSIRPAAVAGRFYPADPEELEATVRSLLAGAPGPEGPPPAAAVVPHAGYVYSGPIAATAYAALAPVAGRVERLVLVGPSHFVPFHGMALPTASAFTTPLGEHPVDTAGCSALDASPAVRRSDVAHRDEHSLEVQLPFVRLTLGPVPTVPLLTGDAEQEEVADALDMVWTAETVVLVSSDLSHYLSYDAARKRDSRSAAAVEALDPDALGRGSACGRVALRGLLVAARRRGLGARTLDLRSSGDTAGDRRRVVGYGAFGFWPDPG